MTGMLPEWKGQEGILLFINSCIFLQTDEG